MLDKMNMSVGSFEKIKGDEVFHFFLIVLQKFYAHLALKVRVFILSGQ